MEGTMTYADEDSSVQIQFARWQKDAANRFLLYMSTQSTRTGQLLFLQQDSVSGTDVVVSASGAYTPGINVPFNIASRHGSTFINGAVAGTALTANTTPAALPDLSSTDMQIGSTFMGTIKLFRVWADDLTDEGITEASTNA